MATHKIDNSANALRAPSRALWLSFALAAITLFCFWPITHHKFINVDDQQYIYQNPHVTSGLSWSGVKWALGTGYASNWHPLTWLSHMLDCNLWALKPGGHHLTNLLFHAANTVLLLLLLSRITGTLWRSAFVAALFAWHPLHVESVAWAAERKDVLSAFFFMLTLWAYCDYAQRKTRVGEWESGRGRGANDFHSPTHPLTHSLRFRDLLSPLFFFLLGLMSKPMLVTLPFLLLLLDYWPLRRFSPTHSPTHPLTRSFRFPLSRFPLLFREKLPFFALAIMASFITYYVQNKGGTVSSAQIVPLSARFANALVAYMRYIGKSFWPTGLSQIYAYPAHWPLGWVAAAALILVLISALVLWQARWRPYLFTGWFWFIGMLVPTIGLVQVGPQSMADRYTYLPSIGLFILVVWAAHDLILGSEPLSQPLSRSGPKLRRRESGRGEESHSPTHPFTHSRAFLRILIPVVALASCLIATRLQLAYWQDGETLFRHAVEVTKDNYIAYDYLGSALSDAGKYEEALPALRQSIKIQPHFAESQFNLGTVLLEQNKLEEAVEHLDAAVKGRPGYASAEMNLGSALLKLGRLPEATPHLAQAAQLKADDAGSHYNFGTALLRQSRFDEAVIELTAAVRLYPDYGEAHRNLGIALISTGQRFLALSHFERAVSLAPADSEAHFNFGLALLEQNHLSEAEAEFNKCISLGAADLRIHYRLASALSRQHKAKEAISHYREALRLSPDFPGTLNELAWLLACTPEQDLRSGNEAVTLAQKACELTGYKEASSTTTLAAAYAEAGRFTDAIATAQKARDLALAAGQQDIAAKAAESLKLYESGKPFREN